MLCPGCPRGPKGSRLRRDRLRNKEEIKAESPKGLAMNTEGIRAKNPKGLAMTDDEDPCARGFAMRSR